MSRNSSKDTSLGVHPWCNQGWDSTVLDFTQSLPQSPYHSERVDSKEVAHGALWEQWRQQGAQPGVQSRLPQQQLYLRQSL